jgi:CheY-like chemotaxis protein
MQTEMQCAKTILIADDDPEIIKALTIRISSMGFSVDSASDGIRALLKARKSAPALLILDIDMPSADGLSVCRTLANKKYPRIPVVILTGRSSNADIEACKALGAIHCKKGEDTWGELKAIISGISKPDGPEAQPAMESALPPNKKSLKVLLVDDDRDLSARWKPAFEERP